MRPLLTVLRTPTAHLTMTYLAIIMIMSLGFSIVLYHASARQLGRPLPGPRQSINQPQQNGRLYFNDEVRQYIEERNEAARQEIIVRLVWLNVLALCIGTGISYLLARQSLEPIEAAMEAQSQFVSDASHELRTPLAVLQTTNEVALRNKNLSSHEARELLEYNVIEVKRLNNLTNGLLHLLKDSQTEITFTPTDIQKLSRDIQSNFDSVATTKHITINNTVPLLHANSNTDLLGQILSILIDNAVKYSHEHGTITISADNTDKSVRLHVKDTGRGIDSSDLPHIFDRFYRADKSRTSGETHGYGLGLSIASKIAAELHANIEVMSKPNKGSTFTIVLPRV